MRFIIYPMRREGLLKKVIGIIIAIKQIIFPKRKYIAIDTLGNRKNEKKE